MSEMAKYQRYTLNGIINFRKICLSMEQEKCGSILKGYNIQKNIKKKRFQCPYKLIY